MGRFFEILNRKWNQAYYREFNLRKQSRKKRKQTNLVQTRCSDREAMLKGARAKGLAKIELWNWRKSTRIKPGTRPSRINQWYFLFAFLVSRRIQKKEKQELLDCQDQTVKSPWSGSPLFSVFVSFLVCWNFVPLAKHQYITIWNRFYVFTCCNWYAIGWILKPYSRATNCDVGRFGLYSGWTINNICWRNKWCTTIITDKLTGNPVPK